MQAPRTGPFLLHLDIAKSRAAARAAAREGKPRRTSERRLLDQFGRVIDERLREYLLRRDSVSVAREALGPDQLIPYGDFLKANDLSYDLGQKLRASGQLKVLQVGGKLMVRKGHAAEFVRNLPLDK